MSSNQNPFEITDYNYIGSAIGNAFFSGVSFEILWDCVAASNTREQLDENVSAAIKAKERLDMLVKGDI
jgi:hypothetical protein